MAETLGPGHCQVEPPLGAGPRPFPAKGNLAVLVLRMSAHAAASILHGEALHTGDTAGVWCSNEGEDKRGANKLGVVAVGPA